MMLMQMGTMTHLVTHTTTMDYTTDTGPGGALINNMTVTMHVSGIGG